MVVYKITNLKNCKIYIGQTVNFKNRMSQHFRDNSKEDSLIRRAIKKYGKENFKKEILFESNDISEINDEEKRLISLFKSIHRENGYNIKEGGDNHMHSIETKKKISLSQLGEKNHMYGVKGSNNKSSKTVIELKTNQIFESVTQASELLKLNLSHIASVCRGKRSSTGGYIFRYLNKNGEIIDVDSPKVNKSRRIKNLDTGKIFDSFKDISIFLDKKIDSGNIIKAIQGKTKTSYGFRWAYID